MCSVAQSCPTPCDPMDCSPPGSSVHGILQARILEWVAMPSSRGSSQPRDQTHVSCIAGGFFTSWATREAPTLLLHFLKLSNSGMYFCVSFMVFGKRNMSLEARQSRFYSSVWLVFSHSAMSDSLWLRGRQHTWLPCSSLTPGLCSDSCPLSG